MLLAAGGLSPGGELQLPAASSGLSAGLQPHGAPGSDLLPESLPKESDFGPSDPRDSLAEPMLSAGSSS